MLCVLCVVCCVLCVVCCVLCVVCCVCVLCAPPGQHVFLELVAVPEAMWVAMGFLVIVDMYIRSVFPSYTNFGEDLSGYVLLPFCPHFATPRDFL